MLRCISKDHPEDLIFYQKSASFYERPRLLTALLAHRRALRVICAPSLYGKSALAYEYATHTFASDEVQWVAACEPSFLLALDTQVSDEFSIRFLDQDHGHHKSSLFVFDGCPRLEDERFETLRSLIIELLRSGHEVLLTTTDVRWLEIEHPLVDGIDARMLLLDSHERQHWFPDGSFDRDEQIKMPSDRDELLLAIPGCRMDAQNGTARFVEALLACSIETEAEALSLLMLLLGEGALHELYVFMKGIPDRSLEAIARHHPHTGMTPLTPMFHAFELDDEDKFALVSRHLRSLCAQLSALDGEDALLDALVEAFMRHGRDALAARLVCGMHDDEKRVAFLDRCASAFLFEGRPRALLDLARTLPRRFFASPERRMSVAFALGLVGEGRLAERVVAKSEDAAEYDEEPLKVAGLFVRLFFGLVDPRKIEEFEGAIASALEHFRTDDLPSGQEHPAFECELLELSLCALRDPVRGFGVLQRIASSGCSVKALLLASNAFVCALLLVWHERIEGGRRGALERMGAIKDLRANEREMLEKLEGHLVHILARQAKVLAPNVTACCLFDRAVLLFGDRAYLMVDDSTLAQIDSVRNDLLQQCESWRADRGMPSSSEEGNTEKGSAVGRRATDRAEKRLRINTLGRFELESYDPKIVIKSRVRKQLRLLISLMAIHEGREIARPQVQRIMWPDSPERNARQSLYSMWSLLNKSVIDVNGSCPFFESYPHSLALNTQLVETDTQLLSDLCKRLRGRVLDTPDYERAIEQAEELYRGPLLPGEDKAEIVAYRKKYQDRLLEALLESGKRLRERGETTLALRYFRFAFDNEPTREDICYQLMLVLWKLGRHGEALDEYFVCRRALIDLFGIEGTAKLRTLYEAILADAS